MQEHKKSPSSSLTPTDVVNTNLTPKLKDLKIHFRFRSKPTAPSLLLSPLLPFPTILNNNTSQSITSPSEVPVKRPTTEQSQPNLCVSSFKRPRADNKSNDSIDSDDSDDSELILPTTSLRLLGDTMIFPRTHVSWEDMIPCSKRRTPSDGFKKKLCNLSWHIWSKPPNNSQFFSSYLSTQHVGHCAQLFLSLGGYRSSHHISRLDFV